VILPFPETAETVDRVAAALAWYTDLDLPDRLQRAAARLAGQSATPERLDAIRVLRQIADAAGDHWIELAAIAAAEAVLAANPEPEIAGADGPVRQLVARLRQNSEAAAVAQAEGRGLDLAQLAEWRTGLAAAASEAGHSEAFTQDLAKRLQELSATDILLLRRHFHSAVSRQQTVAAIRDAVTALDDAAGNDRLAQRMDRGGDALIGMTRLGSASEAAVRELTRLPPARNALVSLNNWINGRIPQADPKDALIGQLRRNLQSYGCLLLLQAVTEECDAAFPGDAGPSAEAWRGRLKSGIVETLPHYARAAATFQAEDATLGDSLIARLTGAARP
jgi:hypothetical protein